MAKDIRYPASIREKSKREDKPMFAFGFDGAGGMEMHNTMDRDRLRIVSCFVINMNHGGEPRAAFDAALEGKIL